MAPKKDQDFLEFVTDQLSALRRVSARRMFGGIGLYCGEDFFALIDDGRLYFCTDETTRPRYEERGMKAFEYAPDKVLRSYYEIPVDVLEDDATLCEWAREAVATHKKKAARKQRRGKTARLLPAALFWILFAHAAVAAEFDTWWHDGKAELDGYHLTVSRYGQDRKGTAVMVFVTEPFSESKRVKVDDYTHANPADTFDALKLNLVRDFQTGIYDYNTMVSVFVRTENLEPVKVSFSSAEWCGHVYGEMIFGAKDIRGSYASYFEGESGPIALGRPEGGITEDDLFIRLRGLRKDFLGAGESRTVPYLPGSFYSRLSHQKQAWIQATIKRDKAPQQVTVPAGTFSTMLYDVQIGDGRTGGFWIEAAYPHRIVKWSLPPDMSGELTGSKRLEYWKLHAEGDEKYLEALGLSLPK